MKVAAKREIAALTLVTLPAAIRLSAEAQAFYPPKVVIGLCYFSLFIVLGMELRGIWKQATEHPSLSSRAALPATKSPWGKSGGQIGDIQEIPLS